MSNMVNNYTITRIQKVLSEHLELGVSIEVVKGKDMYRHKVNPDAIGMWISEERVRAIVEMIPNSATTVDTAVAGAVVDTIQKYNLGEAHLRDAQRNHFEAYLTGTSGLLPQYAAEEAKKLAEKYNLGSEAIARAIPVNVNPRKKSEETTSPEPPLEERV